LEQLPESLKAAQLPCSSRQSLVAQQSTIIPESFLKETPLTWKIPAKLNANSNKWI
jgi:hypothetical protein